MEKEIKKGDRVLVDKKAIGTVSEVYNWTELKHTVAIVELDNGERIKVPVEYIEPLEETPSCKTITHEEFVEAVEKLLYTDSPLDDPDLFEITPFNICVALESMLFGE